MHIDFDKNIIVESFMHKIRKAQEEKARKETDRIVDIVKENDVPLEFACPELGKYISRKCNNGHPFTVSSARYCNLVMGMNFFHDFEGKYWKDYTFNELKYFDKATVQRDYNIVDSAIRLTEVTLPDAWTEIPHNMFKGFIGLKKMHFSDNIENLADSCFSDCGLEELTIPSTVTNVENYAFMSNYFIRKIVFEDGAKLVKFGSSVFSGCDKLENIKLPDAIDNVIIDLFENDNNLKELSIPSGVHIFFLDAIQACINLEKIKFSGKTTISTLLTKSTAASLGLNPSKLTFYFPKKYRDFYKSVSTMMGQNSMPKEFKNIVYY